MRNLTPLNTDPLDEFDLIVQSKYDPDNAALILLRSDVLSRYNLYKNAFDTNSLNNLAVKNYHPQAVRVLRNCYSNPTNALDRLIKNIKDKQPNHLRSVCQYCGIDTDNTIDHYLPQSKYPEYSICHLNLFPCCAVCNPLKNDYWYDFDSNYGGIMNLYLDRWPEKQQFLFADLTFVGTNLIAEYRLDNPNGINRNTFEVIQNHFTRIKLLKKYNNKTGNIYERVCNSYSGQSVFRNNPNAIKAHLLQESENHFKSFGRNHYEGILKEALALNEDFLSFF